jgi:hypothetical protein
VILPSLSRHHVTTDRGFRRRSTGVCTALLSRANAGLVIPAADLATLLQHGCFGDVDMAGLSWQR